MYWYILVHLAVASHTWVVWLWRRLPCGRKLLERAKPSVLLRLVGAGWWMERDQMNCAVLWKSVQVCTSVYLELTKLDKFWNSTSSLCIPCIGDVQPVSPLPWLFLGGLENNLTSWKYVPVCTSTYQSVRTNVEFLYWPVPSYTGTYWYVLVCTILPNPVQGYRIPDVGYRSGDKRRLRRFWAGLVDSGSCTSGGDVSVGWEELLIFKMSVLFSIANWFAKVSNFWVRRSQLDFRGFPSDVRRQPSDVLRQ